MFSIPKIIKKKETPVDLPGIEKFRWEDIKDKVEIGRGGFGAVYRTTYANSQVVVKRMHANDHESKKEFLKEAKLLASLTHENVVKLIAICTKPTNAIMLEFVNFDFKIFGDEDTQVNNLLDFLNHIDDCNECEGFTHLMPVIAKDIAMGMQFLHEKDIIHRDIKTANVLVSNQHYSTQTDENEFKDAWEAKPIVCKLTDFGESRSREIQTRTLVCTKTTNVDRGTPAYMAPEIHSLHHEVSKNPASINDLKKIDIWAYGMVLFNVCNPHLRYPYQHDVKGCNDKIAAITRLLTEGSLLMGHSRKHPNHPHRYSLLNDSKFQARDPNTAFIRDVRVEAEPFCVLATNRQLNDLERFCCNPTEYQPMTVDPTFNLGPYNVTPISYQHLLVNGKYGVHPTMIGPVPLHEKKTKTTYSLFAATIKSLKPELTNLLAFGTDDEKALVGGFNEHFERATHLLCEIHLKKNIEEKLISMNIKGELKQTFIADIFGRKVGDIFESGMSDAKSRDEFSAMLDSVEKKWSAAHENGKEFHKWFLENKAGDFALSVISPVRQRAGLGFPPQKFTTNRSERTNGVIQDFVKRDTGSAKVDEYTFVKSLEKLIKIQEQDVEMAVLSKGEYKLRSEYSHLLVPGPHWDKMTQKQRHAALSRIHDISIEDVSTNLVSTAMSQLSKDVPPVVQQMISSGVDWISSDILTRIAISAGDDGKKEMVELPGTSHETLIIPSKSKPTKPHVVVIYPNGKVECQDCPGYDSSSICSHVLAACLKKDRLDAYLKWVTAAKRKPGGINYSTAITYGMPAGRGRKGNKRPRTGRRTSSTSTVVSRFAVPTAIQGSTSTVSTPAISLVHQSSHVTSSRIPATLLMPKSTPATCVPATPFAPYSMPAAASVTATPLAPYSMPAASVPATPLAPYSMPAASSVTATPLVPHYVMIAPATSPTLQKTSNARATLLRPQLATRIPATLLVSQPATCTTPTPLQPLAAQLPGIPHGLSQPFLSLCNPAQEHVSRFPANTSHVEGPLSQKTCMLQPPYPTAVPGMFMIYLLQFCPSKTSVCFGCSGTLKPNGVIQCPPFDLVIVSKMDREWQEGSVIRRKQSNVYFHCRCECVQKKHFSAIHLQIPESISRFLMPEHKIFLQKSFGLLL